MTNRERVEQLLGQRLTLVEEIRAELVEVMAKEYDEFSFNEARELAGEITWLLDSNVKLTDMIAQADAT